MSPIRISSLVDAFASLSLADNDPSAPSRLSLAEHPGASRPNAFSDVPMLDAAPFPEPIAKPLFPLEDYSGDESFIGRWVKRPQMLERYLRTARFSGQKFPLSRPPSDLHWGTGSADSFLFLGNSPALVYLPAKLIAFTPRKDEAGNREVLLEAEMLHDAYYFGMIDLFSLTGDNPTMDPLFYAYRNTGSARSFKSCWDCQGHLPRPRKMRTSRLRTGDIVLIECSIRRAGSTYVNWYSFFSLRAVSLMYRPKNSLA